MLQGPYFGLLANVLGVELLQINKCPSVIKSNVPNNKLLAFITVFGYPGFRGYLYRRRNRDSSGLGG